MTVLLDPGSGTLPLESYDATSRLWRTTSGLWRAKDITDLASYTTAEAARVTAVALAATYLGNYNAEVTLYNAAEAARIAAVAATAAALSPTAGAITGSPYAADTNLTSSISFLRNTWQNLGGSWTPSVSGYYAIYAECKNTVASVQDNIDYATCRLVVGGNAIATGTAGHRFSTDTQSMHAVFFFGFRTAGQAVTLEVNHSANDSGTTCTFGSGVIKSRFAATTANPH